MPTSPSPTLTVANGTALLPDGSLAPASVHCNGDTIAAVDGLDAAPIEIDATDALVLPGIVDLHGDGFERTLMPRPGVFVDVARALAETRPLLLAAGITTAYVSVTDGWEPGLRSRATLRSIVSELQRAGRGAASPDLRLHVRHERCNTEDHEELLAWIGDGTVRMLSYNDHTPDDLAGAARVIDRHVGRTACPPDELERLLAAAIERRELGRAQEHELAAAARAANVPTASHDAATEHDLERDLDLGVAIAEFPFTIELAHRYRRAGCTTLLGAPNLVRGSSHIGNLSVRDAWDAGVADLICSDYHYPAVLHAPFVLQSMGHPLASAWDAVSRAPAEAAGLADRGRIEPGARADLVVVEPPSGPDPARVRAVVSGGRLAALTP